MILHFGSRVSSKWDTPKSKKGYQILSGNNIYLKWILQKIPVFSKFNSAAQGYLELNLIGKTLHEKHHYTRNIPIFFFFFWGGVKNTNRT